MASCPRISGIPMQLEWRAGLPSGPVTSPTSHSSSMSIPCIMRGMSQRTS
ncbi:unnamed protein product [Symbiodinium pilosum]|uniref:Uncharacterized protein n=1 Tax=Symbiodinium pilosum TaxID=2952 RepID=A0A812NNS3_SYMPI|nr:unnamed protein product [Symbiodinium pilosum]